MTGLRDSGNPALPTPPGSADFVKHDRMPSDYKRDVNGRVSKAEMNRYLPRWRCSTCGQWLLNDELHTVEHCAQRVSL